MKRKTPLSADKRSWRPSPLAGPIVLVTTLNEDGTSNVAPKSWISMMAFEPALLAIGCAREHWTCRNIFRTGEFVVNVPGEDLVESIWRCSTLPHPRPVESAGWTPREAEAVQPPLVEECRAHLECVLVHEKAFGSEVALFGNIVAASVDEDAVSASDPYAYLRPVVFLEDRVYGVIEGARPVPAGGR
jgi:flavin reductase (DIM6/NTAB) family NADH-FMN oxidoreductase RutF